jgi:two-component system, chemotaxis family, CheB/CheR fusion protein
MPARKRSSATPSDKTLAGPAPAPNAAANFPIVGIGASAGGLAAFEAFFSGMPAAIMPGMAFVLVQHLAPDHKSLLTDLVRRYTRMEVFEVEDGMTVQPNCTYIIPPGRDMAFLNGTLQLLDPLAPRGQRLPIDFFFRSLAQDQHERAIGLVLSGTGSDGTLGVRAIKGEGGMVMAQNPESTEYDGMPRSAIATGLVDYVLPPAEMPARLIAYTTHAFSQGHQLVSPPPPRTEGALKKIFLLLRAQAGHDFSLYKSTTISRRIERRMAVHQLEGLDEYVRYLQQTPAEVDVLFRDLLIGVTSFFRDPEAFKALETLVIPRLFQHQPLGGVVRVWVPGCSTGEEAYSLAILLQEQLEALKPGGTVQVFATDIDRQAIDLARAGVYPASIAGDLSPERLAHFFVPVSGGADGSPSAYRIHKGIRDLLVFSEQDVIKDPPFSNLDLISCRNLLIYMGNDLQKRLVPLFHYALNPGGVLFLGTSETVGEFPDRFTVLDRKAKIYQRQDTGFGGPRPDLGTLLPPLTRNRTAPRPSGQALDESQLPLRELTESALLQQLAPTAALVTERGEILYLYGRIGQYLEPAPGVASQNILKMAREGLAHPLTLALHKAVIQQEPVRHLGLRVETNGDFATVDLTVRPVTLGSTAPTAPPLFLVMVEAVPEAASRDLPGPAASDNPPAGAARIVELELELRANEEYLQAANEELETANEELRSSNEEMQSVNEELQSTNEELETSKEELQSVNEELATVNNELQIKVMDLSRANNDMNNLLAGTGIGTVFVDHQLRILRFTPAATQVINLILTDVGRSLGHLVSNLVGYNRLVADVRAVLDDLLPREVEVQTQAGAWYLLRIRPYRTLENVIEGAVISFFDITEVKRTQAALREAESLNRLAVVARDAYDAILVQDLTGRLLAWNPAAERMYGWTEAEALALNIRDLIPESHRAEAMAVARLLGQIKVVAPYRAQRITKAGRSVQVWLTAAALMNETGAVYAITTTEHEIGAEEGVGGLASLPNA